MTRRILVTYDMSNENGGKEKRQKIRGFIRESDFFEDWVHLQESVWVVKSKRSDIQLHEFFMKSVGVDSKVDSLSVIDMDLKKLYTTKYEESKNDNSPKNLNIYLVR